MGIPPNPDDPKQKIVMGYPSMDRYHPAHQMYPQPPSAYPSPAGRPHQGYASSSYQHPPPPGYASSSFPPPLGYDPSPFPHDGKYMNPAAAQNPYPPRYNDFYYQQHYKPLVTDTNQNSSFGRLMLILMIVFVASMCMMSLVMWFLFGTYIPEFEVSSIKISNFTTTNTSLSGIWKVDISVTNTNKELGINFDRIISSIFYRDAILGVSALQPFQVQKMQRFDLNYTMRVEQMPNEQKLQSWVLPSLENDVNANGAVLFSLKLAMRANFTASNVVYRQESLRVLCENMQVNFSPTGNGTLSPGLGNPCLISIHDGLRD
ncbi:hypothetical protein CDL12_24179 [Handroanthus impetiginosus]|uniref:Late embryogenesis abundant protein LEA-2 subgroup domain-containing protein n=1 Tax=Handroanthus impetiginosus TaxID=429701 RepID=A0A2G9GDM4_9LAMI|nr:hypothetical protein CDL12_24179 [Handroanthus impetiginosus]